MALYPQLNDQELAVLLQVGEEHAFAELYSRYSRKLYTFAHKIIKSPEVAEDVVHDVFVRLWEHPESIDPAKSIAG